MKNIVYILILTLITNVAFSQEKPFDKKLFKEQKEDFKIAMGHIESGDDLIAGYPADYRLAVVEYLKANDFNNITLTQFEIEYNFVCRTLKHFS